MTADPLMFLMIRSRPLPSFHMRSYLLCESSSAVNVNVPSDDMLASVIEFDTRGVSVMAVRSSFVLPPLITHVIPLVSDIMSPS